MLSKLLSDIAETSQQETPPTTTKAKFCVLIGKRGKKRFKENHRHARFRRAVGEDPVQHGAVVHPDVPGVHEHRHRVRQKGQMHALLSIDWTAHATVAAVHTAVDVAAKHPVLPAQRLTATGECRIGRVRGNVPGVDAQALLDRLEVREQ